MRLELGCGYRPSPGYLRLDANAGVPDLDVRANALNLPFRSGIFEEVRCVDVLEHLPYRLTKVALAEWARVLTPGGHLYVQVPDCGTIMREYAANPARWRERLPEDLQGLPPILGAAWRILGGQADGTFVLGSDDWTLNAHYAMFDEPALRWFLRRAGFDVVELEVNIHPNLLCWAKKT